MYECKHCKTRTTLRSGTVMQASKLPFQHWFIAIHLLTGTKKPFSSLEMQRQIGHKFYEPIWYMMQKLRKTMGIRDSEYQLDEIVELDEGFFESVDTETPKEDKPQKLKRGRGSERQLKVLVMASTVHTLKAPVKHKKQTKFRYVKSIPSAKGIHPEYFLVFFSKRQQFVEPVGRVIRQFGEGVFEPMLRVYSVELACCQERINHSSTFSPIM